MRWLLVVFVLLHGLIHLMGFAKAFGHAELPQLAAISRPMGVVWLAAALLSFATAVALLTWPRGWWALAGVAALVSQIAIASAWADARFGTVANVVLLVAAVYGFLTQGPFSFEAAFERDASLGLERTAGLGQAEMITEADLDAIPPPVQGYLRAIGVVGQPRVRNYQLRFRGRIRSAPEARWMPFTADQVSFADQPARLFLMRATMWGIPVQAFHRFVAGRASMRVRALGALTMVDAKGEVMDRSETVTLFNDMCLLAPGTLVGPNITWEPVDEHTARARFSNAGQTITATLVFDQSGLLVNFWSDDRSRSSPDGKSFTQLRFSTPLRDYRAYGPVRLARHGQARWRLPEGGEFVYGEFELVRVDYNAERM
jgi:hypothetical protein